MNNIFSGKEYRLSPEGTSLMDEMNNILSGTKYRASPEGVSLMDETNNLASHLEQTRLAGLPLKSKSFMLYAG
jgi:hypothetical protein